ncbi:MAG TPA: hypothetical protein VEA63_15675, partial [Opitutus sp.]|nr:hypothetical protein [Opitutus sp.]
MPSRVHLFWFVIPTLALSLRGQTLPKDSPFLAPPSETAPAHVDSAAGYQLSGMTVVGTDTLLSITRENDQRSQWIAVGQTLDEISVVSYDAAKDQAVIRVGEKEHTLTLRKPSIAAATVSPLIPPNPAAAG